MTAAYPDRSVDLDPAECILLTAIRWWVADRRHGADPLPRLCEAIGSAGAHDAAFSVDRLMSVVARSARQPIAIHCPRCPHLSGDEKLLLHAAHLAQARDGDLAERALRTALLSAHGAEFALGLLEELCELFAEAKLFFRRGREPALVDLTPPYAVEPWLPPTAPGTID